MRKRKNEGSTASNLMHTSRKLLFVCAVTCECEMGGKPMDREAENSLCSLPGAQVLDDLVQVHRPRCDQSDQRIDPLAHHGIVVRGSWSSRECGVMSAERLITRDANVRSPSRSREVPTVGRVIYLRNPDYIQTLRMLCRFFSSNNHGDTKFGLGRTLRDFSSAFQSPRTSCFRF